MIDDAVALRERRLPHQGLGELLEPLEEKLSGTYFSVEPNHLFRYPDEQSSRYNYRKGFTDGKRFDLAVRLIYGNRLTRDRLTGKDLEEHAALAQM